MRGFTALIHERGPQAVKPLVDEFFRRSKEIVVQHDGIVDHFMGDAVMAFFNVPIRREDHVARAVRAAAEIHAAVPGINAALREEGLLKVGIGISTGLAYAGMVGSTSCQDYTALGETVNIASRLQGQAAPGETLADEQVYGEVQGSYPHAARRVLELKGLPEPVQAYALTELSWTSS